MSKKCGSGATKREIAKADTDDGAVVATTMSSFTPLQKALKRFCEKYPRYVKFALCNWAARLVAYWFPNALLHICYRFNFFSKYKINKGMPSTSLIVEAFLENIKGDLLAMPLVFFGVLKLFDYRFSSSKEKSGEGEEIGGDGKDGESTTTTTTETEGGQRRRGWVNLRFKGPFPSVKTVLWQVLFSYFVYDTMFYWSHRWLHQKSNYLRFHKQHHRFAKTIGIASSFQHPVEGAIQLMAWYLPIGLAGWLKGDLHWSSLFSYNCFRWFETVDAHCGYNFPWSPFSILPIFGGAVMHDFHHSGEGLQMIKLSDGTMYADFGNYGASVFWDWAMGTMSPAFANR